MKLVVFVLCLLFALVSTAPSNDHIHGTGSISRYNDADSQDSLNEDIKTEIESSIKDSLNEVLNMIVDAVKSGSELKGEFFAKLNDILQKVKELKIVLGKAELGVLDEIKEYFREYLKHFLQKFGISKREALQFSSESSHQAKGKSLDEVREELKKLLDDFVGKVKDVIKSSKDIKDGFLQKIKEIREKVKAKKTDVRRSASETYEKVVEDLKNYIKSLLEKLGISKRDVADAAYFVLQEVEEYPETIAELKESFFDQLKRLKDTYENGKSVLDGLDKLQKIRETLKDFNIDIGDVGTEYLEKFKNKVKDYWNKLKEKLTSKRSADIDVFGILEELKKEIKDKFNTDKILAVFEKAFKKGSELLEQLREVLKEGGEQRRKKILDFIDRILEDKKE